MNVLWRVFGYAVLVGALWLGYEMAQVGWF
jgi:hypothetical protein